MLRWPAPAGRSSRLFFQLLERRRNKPLGKGLITDPLSNQA